MSTPANSPPNHSNPFASRYVRPGALSFRFESALLGEFNDHTESARDPSGFGATDQAACAMVSRLREVRCGVIIGTHGSGKSTLLRTLSPHLQREMPGGQWVQLTQEPGSSLASRFADARVVFQLQRNVAQGGVLVIDGSEQLPAILRWWIRQRARRWGQYCLLTSHHEIHGFVPLYRTSLSPEMIRQLLSELLPPSDDPERTRLQEQLQRHVETMDLSQIDNLRDLWDDLYECAAKTLGRR